MSTGSVVSISLIRRGSQLHVSRAFFNSFFGYIFSGIYFVNFHQPRNYAKIYYFRKMLMMTILLISNLRKRSSSHVQRLRKTVGNTYAPCVRRDSVRQVTKRSTSRSSILLIRMTMVFLFVWNVVAASTKSPFYGNIWHLITDLSSSLHKNAMTLLKVSYFLGLSHSLHQGHTPFKNAYEYLKLEYSLFISTISF